MKSSAVKCTLHATPNPMRHRYDGHKPNLQVTYPTMTSHPNLSMREYCSTTHSTQGLRPLTSGSSSNSKCNMWNVHSMPLRTTPCHCACHARGYLSRVPSMHPTWLYCVLMCNRVHVTTLNFAFAQKNIENRALPPSPSVLHVPAEAHSYMRAYSCTILFFSSQAFRLPHPMNSPSLTQA